MDLKLIQMIFVLFVLALSVRGYQDDEDSLQDANPDDLTMDLLQPKHKSSKRVSRPWYCYLDSKRGPCSGYYTRYYFDPIDGSCKMFLYGGCRGNKNNFKTYTTCYRVCRAY